MVKKSYSQDITIKKSKYSIIHHNSKKDLYKFSSYKEPSIIEDQYDWIKYYDFKNNKFISEDNGSGKIYPVATQFNINDNLIWDDQYSQYQIIEKHRIGDYLLFKCINISKFTKERGKKCQIFISDKYVIIQYRKYNFIYAD